MGRSPHISVIAALLVVLVASGCGSTRPPPARAIATPPDAPAGVARPASGTYFSLEDPAHAQELVLYALGLLGTGYAFGGRNPEAGLDCSGMVSYIVEQVSGRSLPHNAAQIAGMTRPIAVSQLRPGDLVFFNTLNRRHSHMGIYMGDGRFIHAPSTRGRVRIERLDNPYFRPRIDGARTLVETG